MVYKQNTYRAISDAENLESRQQVLINYQDSSFGQWFYSNSSEIFSGTNSYQKIPKYHQQLHLSIELALDNLDLNWQSNETIRHQIVEQAQQMELSTEQLNQLVDTMVTEKLTPSNIIILLAYFEISLT